MELPWTGRGQWPWAERKPGFHFNYAFGAGEMELIIFIVFGNAAVHFLSFVSCSLSYRHSHNYFRNVSKQGRNAVSGETMMVKIYWVWLELYLADIWHIYVFILTVWLFIFPQLYRDIDIYVSLRYTTWWFGICIYYEMITGLVYFDFCFEMWTQVSVDSVLTLSLI